MGARALEFIKNQEFVSMEFKTELPIALSETWGRVREKEIPIKSKL